ncbi:MAG: histidine kinase [Eubacteriales bacterium]|nr:histidine kinase [Eubacteriales bacterium]
MTMRKFFLKRFRSFFLIMMIPILILTCISMFFQYRNARGTLTAESANTLVRVDENLHNAVSTSAYQYELLTYNPRLVLSLKKFFRHDTFTYSDVVLLNSIRVMLGSVVTAHEYIDSIYLYLDGFSDFFSTSDGFLGIEASTDQDWFPIYQSMDADTKLWITRREFEEYSYLPPTQYITVYQRMGNISGIIIVNLDITDFEHALDTSTSVNNEYLYILDSQNRLLCSNQYGSNLGTAFEEYLQTADLTELNHSWITVNKNYYYLELLFNEDYQISFVALIPQSRFLFQQSTPLFFLIGATLCNCLITLFLAYFTTKRNFQKIEDIIQTFDSAEKGILPVGQTHHARDEYDVILDNVIRVFLQSTYLKQELTEKQYKQEIAEKAALQLQINPHFLFNTLQSLDFKALEILGKPSILNRMIQNLSDILKYSLEDPGKSVTLGNELQYLKKYVEIQKMRYGQQFVLYYEVDEDLMELEMLRLVLQPLVENSISHGIAPLTETGYIKVRIYRRGDFVHFVVIDSGIGMDREEIRKLSARIQDEKSQNIGLTNVNRRLTLQYGMESALRIQGKKGMGTCISFRICI